MTQKIRKFTVFHKEIYGISPIFIRKFPVFHKEISGKSKVKNKEIYGSSESLRPAKGGKIRKLTVFGPAPAPAAGRKGLQKGKNRGFTVSFLIFWGFPGAEGRDFGKREPNYRNFPYFLRPEAVPVPFQPDGCSAKGALRAAIRLRRLSSRSEVNLERNGTGARKRWGAFWQIHKL